MWLFEQRRRGVRTWRMYPPPPSRGGEFGRGDRYSYYGGSGYGGHPAQGYGGGMGMS